MTCFTCNYKQSRVWMYLIVPILVCNTVSHSTVRQFNLTPNLSFTKEDDNRYIPTIFLVGWAVYSCMFAML